MLPLALFGIHNSALNLAVELVILFLVVIWLALIFWTYADARRRIAVLGSMAELGADAVALHEALRELLGNPDALAALTARAREVAQGKYGWDAIARQTLDLYSSLLSENPPR